MSVLQRILRAGEGRNLEALRHVVPRVAAHEDALRTLSDDALSAKTTEFRRRRLMGETLDDFMDEAFAVAREASRRVLGQRPFDVQVMGAAALHQGWVAEMKTGEGKTLTAVMPAYLNALTGEGVHVITANDYLAERDSVRMGRVFGFLGLTTGLILPNRHPQLHEKREQYFCDITYGINTELGFDYLRDNMVDNLDDRVQRGFSYAIVDEVDSVLIDEARTPLIISSGAREVTAPYHTYAQVVSGMKEDEHYEVRRDIHSVMITEAGIDYVERALFLDNMFSPDNHHVAHYVHAAMKARFLYDRDRHYVVLDGKVLIVDEFTGRVLEGRRWGDGVHQAVEAKENVEIEGESVTMATVTLQNFFRMYDKLCGMTGTAGTSAAELKSIYDLEVVQIPTNRPNIRRDHAERVYHTTPAKWTAVVEEVAHRHAAGQPVLVGTTSVAHSEHLSSLLEERGIAHEVLNAKHLAQEADIVAQAGRSGAVTVATNMAGRGVDILLGGNPEALLAAQLRREGYTDQMVAPERELQRPLNEMPLDFRLLRDEAVARRAALETEVAAACAADADRVRAAGGLCVIGTERHESRRIDDQLRGRAGRQGDPGESVFLVSLEDEFLALYAVDALEWADEHHTEPLAPIQQRRVHRAVDAAQAAVEHRNVELRKSVLDYDEVLDKQRKVIYERREQIVGGWDLKELAMENVADVVYALAQEHLVTDHAPDVDAFLAALHEFWPVTIDTHQLAAAADDYDALEALALADAARFYDGIEAQLGSELMRDIERNMMLQIMDEYWREHLANMEMLQDGVHLRAVAQKDPLNEWRKDSFAMFERMVRRASIDFVRYAMHLRLVGENAEILAHDDEPSDAPASERPPQ